MESEAKWERFLNTISASRDPGGVLRMMDAVESRSRGISVTALRAKERAEAGRTEHDHWCGLGIHDDHCLPSSRQRLRGILGRQP